jgi:restriction system protein
MSGSWNDYQEEACSFFRSLGLSASTNVALRGVRTSHNVDVLVKSSHLGFDVTWIVECKQWKTPVTKLHVLALREIVSDTGADRGILLCEAGFQSGATEAANLTNVQVTSLAALTASTRTDILAMRLRELYDRVEMCNELYWNIPKDVRIEKGLRAEVGEMGYSGARVVDACRDVLSRAFRGRYPIESRDAASMILADFPDTLDSPEQVVQALEPLVADLEGRLRS